MYATMGNIQTGLDLILAATDFLGRGTPGKKIWILLKIVHQVIHLFGTVWHQGTLVYRCHRLNYTNRPQEHDDDRNRGHVAYQQMPDLVGKASSHIEFIDTGILMHDPDRKDRDQ